MTIFTSAVKMAILITEEKFGELDDGAEVKLFKLSNRNGMSVDVGVL